MRTLKHWTSICRPTTHWSCSSNIFPTWKTAFSLWTGNVPNDCIHSIQAILHLLDTLKTESQLAQENFHWKILLKMFQMNKKHSDFEVLKNLPTNNLCHSQQYLKTKYKKLLIWAQSFNSTFQNLNLYEIVPYEHKAFRLKACTKKIKGATIVGTIHV